MTRSKVMDRLKKLMRHEESARDAGSFEEAEAFAGKVHQLLLQHKISMSEIDLEAIEDDDPMGQSTWRAVDHDVGHSSKRSWWKERLAGTVARAHFCRLLVMTGSNTVFFVGRESDRDVTSFTYTYLIKQIERHSEKEYCRAYAQNVREHGNLEGRGMTVGYKASWIEGAINSLAKRFREERTVVEETSTTANALICLADNAVTEYMATQKTGKAVGLGGSAGYNSGGYVDGAKWGKNVSIRRGVGSGSSSKRLN